MKLIIQIPCKDEEFTLPNVLQELPKQIDWIDTIEVLIIDDGSTDRTSEVAREWWVDHIIRFPWNRWLWVWFRTGVQYALEHGADIVVNTDADNQYPSRYIKDLVQPIVEWSADIVIGDRQPGKVDHFKRYKKHLQRLWNRVMSFMTWVNIPDSVSGFRAYSRDALLELNVTVRFSYVIDTVIQAYKKWLTIARIPIVTNAPTRPSRLFKNIWVHIKKSGVSIMRVYTMYDPFRLFFVLSLPFILVWFIGVVRFLYYYYLTWDGSGRIQSLVISWILVTIGFNFLSLGIIGDVIARNRMLIEQELRFLKKWK